MLRAACHAYGDVGPMGPPYLNAMRAALEAALAPLPEPVLEGHDCEYWRRNYAHAEEECTAEREMAQQLKAKLAKVRALAEGYGWITPGDIADIIGEEP
jgi:hypothetical protein